MPSVNTETRSSTASPRDSKVSLPYPSFSKAHSKELVGSRDSVVSPRGNVYTPDPTDVSGTKNEKPSPSKGTTTRNAGGVAPPSPPLTTVDEASQAKSMGARFMKSKRVDDKRDKEGKLKTELRTRSSKSTSSLRKSTHDEKPRSASLRASEISSRSKSPTSPSRPGSNGSPTKVPSKNASRSNLHKVSSTDDPRQSQRSRSQSASPTRTSVTGVDTVTESSPDSDATSIAPDQPATYQRPIEVSSNNPRNIPRRMESKIEGNMPDRRSTPLDVTARARQSSMSYQSPQPPPPPPPPMVPLSVPKVDYLLQNGGLKQAVPKSLLSTVRPAGPGTMLVHQPLVDIFGPFHHLLDSYSDVISKHGSLAVATGYRSVARRLLDRLEAVFARDISSESCNCPMCDTQDGPLEDGVSWGEVLELISGRRDLPSWPPFSIDEFPVGLGITNGQAKTPMQKLDVDVPEEYREHYIRQSRKTKESVDSWLARQNDSPSSLPDEVDDDTMTFAILTHLEPEERSVFTGVLGVIPGPVAPKATPPPKVRPEWLDPAGLAISRLYRLQSSPRDPERAIYMLKNPQLHNVLATLAAVTSDEWDILISGRFDGFLWSGAEDGPPPERRPSRGATSTPFSSASRGPTPLNAASRGPTPAPGSAGGPVALDEETEIATLAEVERDLFLGMEKLEDAFEALHLKAETVRRALRERAAGLSHANQMRRGYSSIEARIGTPASGIGGGGGWDSGTDDGIDDAMSLAPDDSASQISSNRKRRPKRRNERRTPALVEEDEEASEVGKRHSKR